MKYLIVIILFSCLAPQAFTQKYKYYFLEFRATGKMEVAISPEPGAVYTDIDSLIVTNRSVNRKGRDTYNEKKYQSYSDAFNALSGAGLEFVQFASLSTVGGGTALIGGDLKSNYLIWRRRVD